MSLAPDHSPWHLDWDDSMSVGIPAIDAEHNHFIDQVNNLNNSILWRMPPSQIKHCMQAVIDDAASHFAHEEKLFKDWEYPETHEHAKIHTQILQALRDIGDRFKFDDTNEYDMIDAGLKIKHTLVEHLLTDDMKYRDFYQSRASNSA